jgi:mannose-6-phosphate isomerase
VTLLVPRTVPKPWGREDIPHAFGGPVSEAIGEVWFEPPAALNSLLIKYIFTSEKLSVQCHPSDKQTLSMGLGKQGKEECWLVLDADPGAQLAIGFESEIDAITMSRAMENGSIEQLLTWHPVRAGDFFYIPANTVHAIGAGITLVEVQQNSDITYRLYDYGRPRELHLKEATATALRRPYPAQYHQRLSAKGAAQLVNGPYFRLDRLDGAPDKDASLRYDGALLVVPLDCDLTVGQTVVSPGQCAIADGLHAISFPASGLSLIAQAA